jgi:hypothetical protein
VSIFTRYEVDKADKTPLTESTEHVGWLR